MIDGFIFYASFYEAIKDLPAGQRLAAYDAITRYALTGEMPELEGVVKIVFTLVKPQIDANLEKRENGKKGGRPRKEKPLVIENENHRFSKTETKGFENQKAKQKEKQKEKVKEKEKDKKEKAASFVKPSVEEVREYCAERGNGLDPQAFCDFYEAKGWKVGTAPMKDWRACVRTWEQRRKDDKGYSHANKFIPQTQQDYNFAELEAAVLNGKLNS